MNPWLTIWTQPRATIAEIVRENPNRSIWWLSAIYGFSSILNSFQTALLGNKLNIAAIFLIAIVLCPIWGYISFSIWSWVVSFTGKLFKGAGTFKEIRAAYAWSCVPLIVNVLLWFLLAALFGRALFTEMKETQTFTQAQVTLLFGILIIRIAVAIWSIVIYLNALAEVQKYSVLRAIGNVIVAAVIVAIFFYLLLLIGFSGVTATNLRWSL